MWSQNEKLDDKKYDIYQVEIELVRIFISDILFLDRIVSMFFFLITPLTFKFRIFGWNLHSLLYKIPFDLHFEVYLGAGAYRDPELLRNKIVIDRLEWYHCNVDKDTKLKFYVLYNAHIAQATIRVSFNKMWNFVFFF